MAGRSTLRSASRASGVRGLDFRAQKYAVGFLLSKRGAHLFQVPSERRATTVPAIAGSFPARSALEVCDRNTSGRTAGRSVVEEWKTFLEKRRAASRSILSRIRSNRIVYRMDGAKVYRSARSRI